MRDITHIVIHCSATRNGDSLFRGVPGKPGARTPDEIIDEWHRERGFARNARWRKVMNPSLTSIGYHFVISTNGATFTGRHLDEVGAHVKGHNVHSIGICMIGTDKFTPKQWNALMLTVQALRGRWPRALVVGHRDLSPDRDGDGTVEPHEWLKTCPGFDVADWLWRSMIPNPAHVLELPDENPIDR